MSADDAVTAATRALLAVLAPLTGTRSTGLVSLQSASGVVQVARGQYAMPVLGGQIAPELLVKVAANPDTEDGHWDVTTTPTPVQFTSNLGGVANNFAAGTQFVLDPPVAGLVATGPTSAAGFTGGTDSSGFGALRQVVDAESTAGPLVNVDLRRSALQVFPAAVLTWQDAVPADGSVVPQMRPSGRVGNKQKLYRLGYTLTIVTSRADSGSARRHEGRWITYALMRALSDRQSVDGEVVSSPSGVQVQSASRESGPQEVFQKWYLYHLVLNCEVTLSGLDDRTFADWLSTRLQIWKPDEALGPIRVVPADPLKQELGMPVMSLALDQQTPTTYATMKPGVQTVTLTQQAVTVQRSLLAEFYSELGYNSSTHAWADQSGMGNNLTVVGTPTINPNALNGFPSITLPNAGVYHRRVSTFVGLPVGSKVSVVIVAKRSASADPRTFWAVPTTIRDMKIDVTGGANQLVSSDYSASAQGLSGSGSIDTRTDRFHVIIDNGNLGTWYDGRNALYPFTSPYNGLTVPATTVNLGSSGSSGILSDVVSYRVYLGVLTQAQINEICLFYDQKYGLDTQTNDKWIWVGGQSNGELMAAQLKSGIFPTFARPRNSRIYINATSGASLVTGAADWGPADFHGWRAQTAADYNTYGLGVARTAAIWSQGESDTASSAWTDAVVALIGNMDSRMGRSDTPWIIPRIHPSSSAAAMRPFQDAVAAAMPTRVYIVNTDDLTMADAQHYTAASHQTIWTRCLQAIDAHYGSTDWAG